MGPALPAPIRWVGMSCVAKASRCARIEAALSLLCAPVHRVRAVARGHGLINGYARPQTLGADRFAALVGAWRNGFAPAVVVAAGTAITVDALDSEGRFIGGLILPGRRLMHAALRSGTAGVRAAAGAVCEFPRSTAQAVASGAQAAAAGAVAVMRARLERHVAAPAKVVLTGGDADWLALALSGDVIRFEDLVLEGLRWIAHDLNAPES